MIYLSNFHGPALAPTSALHVVHIHTTKWPNTTYFPWAFTINFVTFSLSSDDIVLWSLFSCKNKTKQKTKTTDPSIFGIPSEENASPLNRMSHIHYTKNMLFILLSTNATKQYIQHSFTIQKCKAVIQIYMAIRGSG